MLVANVMVFNTRSELWKVMFSEPSCSLWFLFVCEISREPLNGFAPNSHGRHVSSLVWMSLKVKVKGQGHLRQKTAFFGPFGGLHAVYVCLVKHV